MKLPPIVYVLIVGAGLYMAAGGKLTDWLPFGPSPAPAPDGPVIPTPSAELQAIVAPVKTAAASLTASERAVFASYFRDFARVLLADSSVVKSTAAIRAANVDASTLVFGGGKYAAMGAAANKALADGIGLENKALDAASRQRAVDVFQALSWSCQ